MIIRLAVIVLTSLVFGSIPTADGAQAAVDPHAQIQQILNRPMYRQWQLRERGEPIDLDVNLPSAPSRWAHAVLKQMGDFFEWLFHRRHPAAAAAGGGISESLPTILITLAVIIVVILLVVLGMMVFNSFQHRRKTTSTARVLSRDQIIEAMESGNALALGSSDWLDEAQRLATEQNFRAMYRALYLALLSGLHQSGKIEHSRNRTNWVYVRQFRGSDGDRATFSNLTQLFDRVWYGHHLPERGEDLNSLRIQVRTLADVGGRA